MTREEMLSALYQAENAYKEIYGYADRAERLHTEKEREEKEIRANAGGGKAFLILALISIVLSAVFGVLALADKESFINLWLIAFWMALTCILAFGVPAIGIRVTLKKHASALAAIEPRLQAAIEALNRKKAESAAEMQLYNQMVPHACQNPSHVRTFIGYIESGRAATLKEASDLVEEYIHRERMEQLAEKQVATTENIQNSIDRRQF